MVEYLSSVANVRVHEETKILKTKILNIRVVLLMCECMRRPKYRGEGSPYLAIRYAHTTHKVHVTYVTIII